MFGQIFIMLIAQGGAPTLCCGHRAGRDLTILLLGRFIVINSLEFIFGHPIYSFPSFEQLFDLKAKNSIFCFSYCCASMVTFEIQSVRFGPPRSGRYLIARYTYFVMLILFIFSTFKAAIQTFLEQIIFKVSFKVKSLVVSQN